MSHANTRQLSNRQVQFIAIGGALGTGLFLSIGQGIRVAGPSMILAYVVAGLMVYAAARCLGEMMLADTQPRMFISYTERFLGARAGFVQAWSYWFSLVIVGMVELTATALLLRVWFPALPTWAGAMVGLAGLFAINRLSVHVFGEVEFWMSLLKVATIAVFLVVGVALLVGGSAALPAASLRNLWADGGVFPNGAGGFLAALPLAVFALGGAEVIGIAGAQAADPVRSLPRAINGLILRLGVFYVGATLVTVSLLRWSAAPVDASPFVLVFSRLGLPAAAGLMNVVLISALLSSCNSVIYASSRTMLELAATGGAPARLRALNRHGAPEGALWLALAAISLTILLDYLVPRSVLQLLFGILAVIGLANWSLMVLAHLRFRARHPDPASIVFRAPASPWSNYFVLLTSAVVLFMVAGNPGMHVSFALAALMFAALWLLGGRVARPARSL